MTDCSRLSQIEGVDIPPDSTGDRKAILEAFKRAVRALIAADSKATPLKSLQGSIWAAGYADGSLKGP
jgi:methionine salvage enolase-phosphatase E1